MYKNSNNNNNTIIIVIIILLIIAFILIIIAQGYLPVLPSQKAKGNHFNSPHTTILQSRNKKEWNKYSYHDLSKHMYIIAVNFTLQFAFAIPHL